MLRSLAQHLQQPLKIAIVFGGVSAGPQIKQLGQGVGDAKLPARSVAFQ